MAGGKGTAVRAGGGGRAGERARAQVTDGLLVCRPPIQRLRPAVVVVCGSDAPRARHSWQQRAPRRS